MSRIYFSAAEFIKKREFDVWIPAFYNPHATEEEKNPTFEPFERINPFKMVSRCRRHSAPFRQLDDPKQMQKGKFSIEIMLDMYAKQIEFEIANDFDIPEIFDGLDRYLLTLQTDVSLGNESTISYVKLVIKWRADVFLHYFRYMSQNPTAKEALYPNNSPTQNLLHLMLMTGGSHNKVVNLDPLRARANPPYNVEDVIPGTNNKVDSLDDSMGSSLGLSSQHHPVADDGKGFSLDEFLGKR